MYVRPELSKTGATRVGKRPVFCGTVPNFTRSSECRHDPVGTCAAFRPVEASRRMFPGKRSCSRSILSNVRPRTPFAATVLSACAGGVPVNRVLSISIGFADERRNQVAFRTCYGLVIKVKLNWDLNCDISFKLIAECVNAGRKELPLPTSVGTDCLQRIDNPIAFTTACFPWLGDVGRHHLL